MFSYKTTSFLLVSIFIVIGSGCASVTSSKYQSLSVEARERTGAAVVDASCALKNDRGTWYVKTPGTTSVHKSYEALHVKCEKEGLTPGTALIDSAAGGAVWGNILIGGGIGWLIDHNTGTAYDYPPVIQLLMGEHLELKPERGGTGETSHNAGDQM